MNTSQDLGALSCTPDLTKVHAIYIFMGNGDGVSFAPIYIDNVVAN